MPFLAISFALWCVCTSCHSFSRLAIVGAYLGSYEMIQKTRTMLANHVQSLEEKSGVTRKLKDSLERDLRRLGAMGEQLEKEMEAYAEDHGGDTRRPPQSSFHERDRGHLRHQSSVSLQNISWCKSK